MSPARRVTPQRAAAAAGLLALAVALATLPLLPAYGSSAAWVAAGAGVAVGGGLAGWCHRRRLSATTTLGLLVLGHLVVGWLVVTPPWRVAPSTGARALTLGVVTGWKDVLTLSPPLGAEPAVLVAPWLLGYLGGALAVAVALRRGRFAALGAVAPAGVLMVALLLADRPSTSWAPVAIGIGVTLLAVTAAGLLRGTLQPGRPLRLAALLVVPVAAAALVPGALGLDRTVLREDLEPPFDPARYESPLASFRAFQRAGDEVQLHLSAPLEEPLRLAVLDSYDGIVWRSSVASDDGDAGDDGGDGGTGGAGSGQFRRVGGVLPATGDPVEVEVEIAGLRGVWLPTVGTLRELTSADQDLRDALRYNSQTASAVVVTGLHGAEHYRLAAAIAPVPTDAELADAPAARVDLGPVARVPGVIGVVAREWAGAADTPLEQVRALTTRLAETGYYSDGLDGRSGAGHGADRMVQLLDAEVMIGNDEQYASALALLARELGLPARVVLGFVPDEEEPRAVTEDGGVDVLGSEVTAWVEVAFAGYGWVPFFPTPPSSRTPDEATTVTTPQTQPLVTQPRPLPPAPTTAPEREVDDVRVQEEDDGPEQEHDGAASVTLVVAAVAGGLLLVLLAPLVVVLGLKAARRRRRRRAPDQRRRAIGAWEELVAAAADVGRPLPRESTRTEAAALLEAAPGTASVRLARGVDAAQFAPESPTPGQVAELWEDLRRSRAALLGPLGWWRRARARVSLASLRRPGRRREP